MWITDLPETMKQKAMEWLVTLRGIAIACVLLCSLTSACAQEQPLEAWWLKSTFTASQTAYKGIAVAAIDPNWVKMTVLSYEILPEDSKSDLDWMRKDGFEFVKEGQFSRKGLLEHVAVGVFEDRSGKGGRFLLVLRQDGAKGWSKLFLHQEVGERGFGVLVSKAGNLYWGTCMLCGNFRKLTISESGATLE